MIVCACLDLLERIFPLLLRCKFPEFVKVNGFIVFVIVAAYCWNMAVAALSSAEHLGASRLWPSLLASPVSK